MQGMRFALGTAFGCALLWAACDRLPDAHPPPDGHPGHDAGAPPDLEPPQGVGTVLVNALDDDTGLPLPARVLVTAVPPTPSVRFDVDERGRPVNGEFGVRLSPGVIGAPEGVLLVSGSGWFDVPAGTYDLFITRGPEWEADERRVGVVKDHSIRIDSPLRRTVDTSGWLAADLHVHTARSFDSRIPVEDRVVSEVAVGVEVIVATDHNVFSDLQPDVDLFGYHALARAFVGDEFNFWEGHGGAYPMPYDAKDPVDAWGHPTGGAVAWSVEYSLARLIHAGPMFDLLHGLPTAPAVTINHPRLLPDLGYFTNVGWAPPDPLPTAGSFDAIEILNGYMDAPDEIATLLRDWFFLLSSGVRVTGLGSSDTHRLRDVKAGFPRTWLRMPTEDVTKLLPADLADAIKHQRAIASNGPFARLTVDGAAIGDLVTDTSGIVTVDAFVDAPDWIDVDRVRLYVNGQVAQEIPLERGLRPRLHLRFRQALPAGDAWLALAASGSKPLPTALIGEHEGGVVTPFAITSPVFVDGDGDGAWRPRVAEPDPGPIAPQSFSLRPSWPDGSHLPGAWPPRRMLGDEPAPMDCEPPLWMDPANWANP